MTTGAAVSVLQRVLAAVSLDGVEHTGDLVERLEVARKGVIQALRHLGEQVDEEDEPDTPDYPTHAEQVARGWEDVVDLIGPDSLDWHRGSGW